MKRTLPTLLLALLAAPLWAQSSDNRLTLSVVTPPGSHEAVLTLSLDNPTVALTAVEAYLTLPDDVSLGQGTLDAAHCAASHALTEGVVGGRLFVSVASPALDTFTGGALCSWPVDLASLTAGDYTITATGLFAVGVADGAVTTYTTDDLQVTLTISDVDTGIRPAASQGTLRVYTLQGLQLGEPVKGQVNIVNGKKVLPL